MDVEIMKQMKDELEENAPIRVSGCGSGWKGWPIPGMEDTAIFVTVGPYGEVVDRFFVWQN